MKFLFVCGIATGNCTEMLNKDGTFAGMVVRLAVGYPKFDSSNTTFLYDVQNNTEQSLSHADLELIICNLTHCDVVAATANSVPTAWDVQPDGRGDPSFNFFLHSVASDLAMITLPSFTEGTFSVTVAGEAFQSVGIISFKFGQNMVTGRISLPVCNIGCSLVTIGVGKEQIIETKTGHKFKLMCFSNGCCIPTENGCFGPLPNDTDTWGWQACKSYTTQQFLQVDPKTVDATDFSVMGVPCPTILLDDESPNSPSIFGGGLWWCF